MTARAQPRVRTFVVALLLATAVALGFAVRWCGRGGGSAPPRGSPALAAPEPGGAPVEPASTAARRESASPSRTPSGSASPLGEPDGDGRSGLLTGRVTRGPAGVAGVVVELVAGLDRTTATATDADGRYRLAPLHPDAARVAFRLGQTVLAQRDVVVRHRTPTRFDLEATPPPDLVGTVLGPDRTPLVGATIDCDGQRTWTGPGGQFVVRRHATGPVRVVVTCDGMATRDVAAWSGGERTIVLAAGATLEVVVPAVPEPGPVWLYVLPEDPDGTVGASWPLPLRVSSGGVVRIGGLPAADVAVRAFHAFAVAAPVAARLRAGHTAAVELSWRRLPELIGTVVDAEGRPVDGATVHLWARDQHEAMFVALGSARQWLRTCAVERLPAADQTDVTGAGGRWRFGLPELQRGSVWLEACLGTRTVRRRLPPDASRLELVLPD